jgi:hypothetical protein
MDLPNLFVLYRFKPNIGDTHPNLEPFQYIAVLVSSSKHNDGTWSLNMIANPSSILYGGRVRQNSSDIWFNGDIETFDIRGTDDIYQNNGLVSNIVIHTSQIIPVLKLSKPCQTLGRIFTNLADDENSSWRFTCRPGIFIPDEQAKIPILKPKIPQHIIDVYIQSLIDKKETCPINMEPLEKGKISITPCGHVMNASSVECWMRANHSCPVCRSPCSAEQLQLH